MVGGKPKDKRHLPEIKVTSGAAGAPNEKIEATYFSIAVSFLSLFQGLSEGAFV